MTVLRTAAGLLTLILLVTAGPVSGAPVACPIVEGSGIGEVRIGMTISAALAISGPPLSQRAAGSDVIYAVRPPWSQITADRDIVQRVSTRSPECRSARGIGVGATLEAVRAAHTNATGSSTTPVAEGDLLRYPFAGIQFLLRNNRVDAVEVFRAETLASAPTSTPTQRPEDSGPASPAPAATTAPNAWAVLSTSFRVEQTTLVVSGTIENRRAPQTVYVDVQAFNGTGQGVGQGDAPAFPNPVPAGGTATFEVRIAIDQVVRRYVVTIRPIGSLSAVLAQHMAEITNFRQFGAVIARDVRAELRARRLPATREDLFVEVTNRSAFTLTSMTVYIRIEGVCAPRGRGVFSGTLEIDDLRLPAGDTDRVPLILEESPCLALLTWEAKITVLDVKIADERTVPSPPQRPRSWRWNQTVAETARPAPRP